MLLVRFVEAISPTVFDQAIVIVIPASQVTNMEVYKDVIGCDNLSAYICLYVYTYIFIFIIYIYMYYVFIYTIHVYRCLD